MVSGTMLLGAAIWKICPCAPGRISKFAGNVSLPGHSMDSSSALNITRYDEGSPGWTTGGSNAAVAWTGEVMSMLGWDSIRDMSGSWGGGGDWARADRSKKLQIPNSKLQINIKLQTPKPPSFTFLALLEFEVWDFFGVWSLEFGAFIYGYHVGLNRFLACPPLSC